MKRIKWTDCPETEAIRRKIRHHIQRKLQNFEYGIYAQVTFDRRQNFIDGGPAAVYSVEFYDECDSYRGTSYAIVYDEGTVEYDEFY